MTFLALRWANSRTHARDGDARSSPLDAALFHERHLDDVFRYVSRRLARREDAEDVCAEVFAAAFETLPRFRGDVEPKLWLLGIARRKVADALRRQTLRREVADALRRQTLRREVELPPDFDLADASCHSHPPRAALQAETRQKLRDLLANLKDEQREVLLLKYVEELSVEEIAVVMNRSHGAANSLLQRARAAAFKGGRDYFLDFETPTQNSQDPKNEVKS
ncbi:MAG TPA: RNA polymerase sigma factor [Abditibacterium sp.]|jgi:RNA polymerase sigma-70 factor (ECF subfamily)